MRQLRGEGRSVREVSEITGRSIASVSRHTRGVSVDSFNDNPSQRTSPLSQISILPRATAGSTSTDSLEPSNVPVRVQVHPQIEAVEVISKNQTVAVRTHSIEIDLRIHLFQEGQSIKTDFKDDPDDPMWAGVRGMKDVNNEEAYKLGRISMRRVWGPQISETRPPNP